MLTPNSDRAYELTRSYGLAQNEAITNRNWALDAERRAVANKQQETADQYGYQVDFQNRQANIASQHQQAGYQHEDEMFQQHLAGTIAEQQLQALQAQKMAQFQAGQVEQRDYRQQGFDLERQGQQQDFQTQRDEYQAGQAEERDYRMADIDKERQGLSEQWRAAGQVYGDEQRAQAQQQAEIASMQHAVVLNKLAYQGRVAEENLRNLHEKDMISPRNQAAMELITAKAQEEEDRQIVTGLENGNLYLPPEARVLFDQNDAAKVKLIREGYNNGDPTSTRMYSDTMKQINAREAALRRLAKPTRPEDKQNALSEKINKWNSSLPEPLRQYAPKFDNKGNIVGIDPASVAGMSKARVGRPISDQEAADYYDRTFGTEAEGVPPNRDRDGNVVADPQIMAARKAAEVQKGKEKLQASGAKNKQELQAVRETAAMKLVKT